MRKKGVIIVLSFVFCLAACAKKGQSGMVSPTGGMISMGAGEVWITEAPTEIPSDGGQAGTATTPSGGEQAGTPQETKKINEFVKGGAWELGNTQGNLLMKGYVCESEGKLYYRDLNHEGHLCVCEADGSGKRELSKVLPAQIQVVGEYVYFTDGDEQGENFGKIWRVRTDGTGEESLGEDKAGFLLVTGEGIFYNQNGSGAIVKMALDGSSTEIIAEPEGAESFAWLGIYGDCIITGNSEGSKGGKRTVSKVELIKLDGSGRFRVGDGCMLPHVGGDTLFFVNEKNLLASVSLRTGEEKEWEKTTGTHSFFMGSALYYMDYFFRQLRKVDLAADEISVVHPDGYLEAPKFADDEHPVYGDNHLIYLYGTALNRLYYVEQEEDGAQNIYEGYVGAERKFGLYPGTFKYYEIATGEVKVVP